LAALNVRVNRTLGYGIIVDRSSLPTSLATRIVNVAASAAPAHRYAIVIDSTVAALHGDNILNREIFRELVPPERTLTLKVPPGEREKSRERWASLTDALLEWGAGRDTTIIAIGGGVICDLAGFIAATFMRGIPVIQVPTTLLAMVDASVGGKTGVDTVHGKNLVGAFHNPSAVIVDPDTLKTLPGPIFRSGLAEMIKHGVLADEDYFNRLSNALPELASQHGARCEALTALIADSIDIKAAVVLEDHRESGKRQTLNFGHTIAHAIETHANLDMLHGDAVAIGMVVESEIAERMGIADKGTTARVRNAVLQAGLPATVAATHSIPEIVAATYGDKKARSGQARYSLPSRIGTMAPGDGRWSVGVPDAVATAALNAHRG
jgi:3-dehydroquinate synthase